MTHRISFRPQARAEIRQAKSWYNEQVPGLGQEFARTVDAAFAAIAERPEAFAKVYGEHRQCVMRRFPYSIFFRVASGEVIVIAVHHQSRDPAVWQGRAE
ncbi:MAG: type II toxin-antitoxin system RelE/ParE family toxin [Phycisphaeraceae bacterium]